MVLLSLLALGLLGLSTISVRASGQQEAMQQARANARLAMVLALGDLQRTLGPDQSISAPARLIMPEAPKSLTGAWRSHLPTPSEPTVDPLTKFSRWLVSDPEASSRTDGTTVPIFSDRSALLIGEGTLGEPLTEAQQLRAGILALEDGGRVSGGLAYAVADESAKARIDLESDDSENSSATQLANLGEGRRFGIEALPQSEGGTGSSEDGFAWWEASGQAKLISLDSSPLLDATLQFDRFHHELTTASRGLLTDTARGGLRKDMSALFNEVAESGSLPADLDGETLYIDADAADADAAPAWNLVADWANKYRNLSASAGDEVSIEASLPRRYRPYTDRRGSISVSLPSANSRIDEFPVMPVVTRVEMVFSIVARYAHGGWPTSIRNATNDPRKQFMLHMIYSPIVTVYNPYNVPLEFPSLQMAFADVPVGFNFFVNGRAQLTRPAPLNQLYVWREGGSSQSKEFGFKLVPQLGSRSGSITLQPGESRIFGTSVAPDWSWAKDRPGDGSTMFDWRSDKTGNFELAPGWNAAGVGFDIDWLVPAPLKSGSAAMTGVLPLSSTDRVSVSFEPLPSQASGNTFATTVQLDVGRGRFQEAGVFEFSYRSVDTLKDFLSDRYQNDVSYPVQSEEWRTSQIFEADATEIADYVNVKPFAIFSLYNKTTLDAGSASAPGMSHPPTSLVTQIDATRDDPAVHPFEAAMLPVQAAGAGNAGAIEIDPMDRAYSFTGVSAQTGVRAMPLYEIPQVPPQSVAQIRHANLAGSGHFPRFAYTAGESFAHPMISAEKVIEPGDQGYEYLDHSWLANNALWDSWFFSTLCDYEGAAFSGNLSASQNELLTDFLDGERRLLNSRLSPRVPGGSDVDSLASELSGDSEFYRKSARYLWVDGPFNVNSTSVEAWKTVLSSLNKSDVTYLDPLTGSSDTLEEAANPLPRFRRPAGPDVTESSLREDRWRGFRTLDEDELDKLARAIVEVVQERGPFLSLSQFVNRDPLGEDEEVRYGALQEAIQRSGINEELFQSTTAVGGNLSDIDGRDIPVDEARADGFAYPEAMAGPNYVGAPGFLTQGDVLSALGTVPTVRGDTFKIYAYGESVDASGKVTARAWCEATVQRQPDFVDPSDEPEASIGSLSPANERFGRRFEIVSFRWRAPEEI